MKKIAQLLTVSVIAFFMCFGLIACRDNGDQKSDITGISFVDTITYYNGLFQTIAISGTLPSGVTVTYEQNNAEFIGAISPGNYEITATMTGPKHNTLTLTATLSIVLTEPSMFWFGVPPSRYDFRPEGRWYYWATSILNSQGATATSIGNYLISQDYTLVDSYEKPAPNGQPGPHISINHDGSIEVTHTDDAPTNERQVTTYTYRPKNIFADVEESKEILIAQYGNPLHFDLHERHIWEFWGIEDGTYGLALNFFTFAGFEISSPPSFGSEITSFPHGTIIEYNILSDGSVHAYMFFNVPGGSLQWFIEKNSDMI
jgi:hypothetical protein